MANAPSTLQYDTRNPGEQAYPSQEIPFEIADAELLASPIALPCGRVLPNRLVKRAKVAMYEHLATFAGGPPNQYHVSLYSKWAKGGWGMIVTGNCQISSSHLTLGRDLTVPSDNSARNLNLEAFRALSAAIRAPTPSPPESSKTARDGALAILQLSHCGRQSPRILGGRLWSFRRPLCPSSRRVGDDTTEGLIAKLAYKLLFPTPRVITRGEIVDVVEAFVNAARVACDTGFDGVELHAAHGYLISQFLSPKLNSRQDEYAKPLLLIQQIITGIRAVTPCHFVLGIKLNAGDYVTGGVSEAAALEHVRQIALLGIDFIEISGGDYENPAFVASASHRQAFFSSFSRQVVQNLPVSEGKATPLIVLTGALRTPSLLAKVIRQKHAHLLGIGRLSVLCPDLPHQLSPSSLSHYYDDSIFPLYEPVLLTSRWFPKLAGASVTTAWYVVGMRQLADGEEIDMRLGTLGALFWMWAWAGPDGLKGIATWTIFTVVLVLITARLAG